MSVDRIILWLMAIFMALGALDRMLGGRFGLGGLFLGGSLRLGAAAGGKAQNHHTGQSQSKQLLLHHNNLLYPGRVLRPSDVTFAVYSFK